MKSILLKLDDSLFEETDKQVKATHSSRSNYIKAAIESYNRWHRRKMIEEQLAKEVALLKEYDPDKGLKKEDEIASLYDLQKYLDDQRPS